MRPATPHDLDIMARTVWGEARGESHAGRVAVAETILNRVKDKRWPDTIAQVCRQHKQFSCWNEGDPNRAKMEALSLPGSPVTAKSAQFLNAYRACLDALESDKDATQGANHYFATWIKMPWWAKKMTQTIKVGVHRFFRG